MTASGRSGSKPRHRTLSDAHLQSRRRLQRGGGDARHRLAKSHRDLREQGRIAVVFHSSYDRRCPGRRTLALEDARADEDAVGTELHHQRRVSRSGDAAGREVDDRQAAVLSHLLDKLERRLDASSAAGQFYLPAA